MRGLKSKVLVMVTVASIISLCFILNKINFWSMLMEAEDISTTVLKEQHDVVNATVENHSNQRNGDKGGGHQQHHPILEPHVGQLPSNLTWVPILPAERQNIHRCTGPFQHCCIGVCRSVGHVYKPETKAYDGLFVRPTAPNMPIIDMRGLLTIVDRIVQRLNLPWCTLWFVGDSLSSDHAIAAICQLAQLGYEMTGCNMIFGDIKSVGDQYCTAKYPNSTLITKEMAEMVSNNIDMPCRRVRVRHSQTNFAENIYNTPGYGFSAEDEAGPIVFNHGVHCNTEMCMVNWMRNVFTPFYVNEYLGAPNATKERYFPIWREHEPQHYDTPGGVFEPGVPQTRTCKHNITSFNNYRNEIAERYLKEHEGLLGEIPIVRLFQHLEPMSMLHWYSNNKGDCTHYCYSPWRFDLSWHGIAQGLEVLWRKRQDQT